MKKILSLLMAAVTSLALTSCSGNSPVSQAESVLQSQTQQLATEEQPSVELAVTADSVGEVGTSAAETPETSELSRDESETETSSSAPEVTDPYDESEPSQSQPEITTTEKTATEPTIPAPEVTDPYDESEPSQSQPEITTTEKTATEPTIPAPEVTDPYDESEPSQSQPEITTTEKNATEPTPPAPDSGNETEATGNAIDEDGTYSSCDDVALYIHMFGHLPGNFITKKQARELGWGGGSVEDYAPGMCIGGDHFGNYEGLLPDKPGRSYTECDIDTLGRNGRGAKRIIFSNDGLIYYTEDHYSTFTLLYGEE